MNKFLITGNIVKKPEGKGIGEGELLAQITVAVGREYKNKQTNEYETDFFNLVAYGKTADYALQYLEKGDLVEIESQIKNYKTEKDGETRYGNNYTVRSINKLRSSRKQEASQASASQASF